MTSTRTHKNAYRHNYYIQNKEYLLEQSKIYYENNKSTILIRHKLRHSVDKNDINLRARTKYNTTNIIFNCECGSNILFNGKRMHDKSLKHTNYINTIV